MVGLLSAQPMYFMDYLVVIIVPLPCITVCSAARVFFRVSLWFSSTRVCCMPHWMGTLCFVSSLGGALVQRGVCMCVCVRAHMCMCGTCMCESGNVNMLSTCP